MSATRAIHPIRDCPEDILKMIFEATVSIDKESRERGAAPLRNQATTLASICSTWRMIAINTPKLWSNAVFAMDRPSIITQAYWESTVRRVKEVPATITIVRTGQNAMNQLSALRIPPSMTIKRLDLHIQYATYARSFPEEWKAHPFEIIYVYAHAISNTSDFDNDIECRQLLGQARAFHLQGTSFVTIDLDRIHNAPLTRLSLTCVVHIDLKQLLLAFPSLKTLELLIGCYVTPLLEIITAAELRTLAIWGDAHLMWLAKAHFPQLHTLSCRGPDPPLDHICAFLSLHRTVVLLDISYPFGILELDDLVSYAQQGSPLTLVINESRRMDIITSPNSFPILPVLKIVQVGQGMTLDAFEELVKARCLPRHHPESKAINSLHVIKKLYISGYSKTSRKFQGFDSGLYREATRSIVEDPTMGETMCLTWS